MWTIDPAAEALRNEGFTVMVAVDNDDERPFAEAEADRNARAAARARRAASYRQYREDPGRTLRRIDKLQANRRYYVRVIKHLAICVNVAPGHVATLKRHLRRVDERLAYWADIVARAEADGAKIWRREDFAPGDFVRRRREGPWFEVLRVNRQTLTIPHIDDRRPVVTRADHPHGTDATYRLPYNAVEGRCTAEDLASSTGSDGT
jgi:hypothetical protein